MDERDPLDGRLRDALLSGDAIDGPATLAEIVERGSRRRTRRRVALSGLAIIVVVGLAAAAVAATNTKGNHVSIAGRSETTTASSSSVKTTTSSSKSPESTTLTTGPIGPHTSVSGDTVAPTTGAVSSSALTAAPNSGLPERGWVTVSGSGFPPVQRVFVVECPAGLPSEQHGCDTTWWSQNQADFFTDGAGNLVSGPLPIRRVLGDGTDCATTASRCELRLVFRSNLNVLARTPLSFAGPPGPAIPMTLHADPSTGLVDRQQVHVTGDRFMPASISLEECAGYACTPSKPIIVAADGTLDTTFTVHRTFSNAGQVVNCGTDACYIWTGQVDATKVPISFAPLPSVTTTTAP